MRKHTIIGMAGHIDHGKTALIKALTGIQTDQHKEEQERGITIDIGFAYWKDNITIIDVPGHEKFVRNMVAGVSTVDLFLLVIAADDGIMPQTIEHLEILKFFGVTNGVVAINKVDLVEEEWLLLVEEEITSFLKSHDYELIPVVPVSAIKNQGIEELHRALEQKINNLQTASTNRPFRLNIDRSFSAKGFGSVVTGTVLSSEVKTGDPLMLLPQQLSTKVRGLQVHQHNSELASSGQRTAINISGLSKEDLPRGTVLAEPDSILPTREILAEIKTVAKINLKIKRHTAVRLHIGTAEVIGKIYWFDEDRLLEADKTYHMRIKFSEPGVTAPGDAVLIRSFSPVTTIAGGRVLHIDAPGIKRIEKDWQKIFEILSLGDIQSKIKLLFEFLGYSTLTINEIKHKLFETEKTVHDAVYELTKQKHIVDYEYKNESHYVSQQSIDHAIQHIKDEIEKSLLDQDLSNGLNNQQLKNILKKYRMSEAFLQRTLEKAKKSGQIFFDGALYSTEQTSKSEKISKIQEQIIRQYKENRFLSPDLTELSQRINIDSKDLKNLLISLVKNGKIKSIGGQFYLHHDVFSELLEFLKSHFSHNSELDVAAMKDFVQGSRKYVIPIFEFLDNNGYTQRRGDVAYCRTTIEVNISIC